MIGAPRLQPESQGKKSGSDSFPVMETFSSIQGEGFHTGAPAFFIRLGGCNVGCHWCDVKESWDKAAHSTRSITELAEEARKFGSSLIIITGGEPLEYDLSKLTAELKQRGFKLHLETSGSEVLSGTLDWICLSPKKTKEPSEALFRASHELKVVIYNQDDLRFAEKMKSLWNRSGNTFKNFYLQPEWSRREKSVPMILDYIKEHPEWRISLQTHKYIGVR